jgi:hypothetical protein
VRWLATLWLRAGVIDQIDAGIAAIELQDRSIVHVSVELLPTGAREGDRVRFRLDRPSLQPTIVAGRVRPRRNREE